MLVITYLIVDIIDRVKQLYIYQNVGLFLLYLKIYIFHVRMPFIVNITIDSDRSLINML